MPVQLAALRNWIRLSCLVTTEGMGNFNQEEVNTYLLLKDFVFSTYAVTGHFFIDMFNRIDHMRACCPHHGKLFASMLSPLKFIIKVRFHELRARGFMSEDASQGIYLRTLRRLFVLEMCDVADTFHRASSTRERRQDAAREAYRQCVSWHCLERILLPPSEPEAPQEKCKSKATNTITDLIQQGPLIQPCPWLDHAAGKSEKLQGWPEYLWHVQERQLIYLGTDEGRRETFRVGEDVAYDTRRPQYIAISHTWGRWIKDDEAGFVIPNGFQYPIPRNKTFLVEELAQSLCNFQRLNSFPADCECVWLDLLCIPQGPDELLSGQDLETRQREIARQGSIFHNAVKVIGWLHELEDLSCLEAFFELSAYSLLSLEKMASQETIARSSRQQEHLMNCMTRTLVADPNEPTNDDEDSVGNSRALTVTFDWVYREGGGLAPDPGPRLPQAAGGSSMRTVESKGYGGTTHPSKCYFTSLWTLQEICLRPDIYLATRDWKVMSLTSDGTWIPLNGFVALSRPPMQIQTINGHEKIRRHFLDIQSWMVDRQLAALLCPSPMEILSMANKRQCTSRRAEAIISALGATTWFDEVRQKKYNPESDLILEKYPAKFIEEVRHLIPSEILMSSVGVPIDYFDARDPGSSTITLHARNGLTFVQNNVPKHLGESIAEVAPFAGSLLPFSHADQLSLRMSNNFPAMTPKAHESVEKWSIKHSGNVHITTACILSLNKSSFFLDQSQDHEQVFHFTGFMPSTVKGTDGQDNKTTWRNYEGTLIEDVEAWVQEASRSFEVQFVVVSHYVRYLHPWANHKMQQIIQGVVLRGLSKDVAKKNRRCYINIGFFELLVFGPEPLGLPDESLELDWIVL
ncbi:hypothetical protein XA68_15379 [Ophiocordyceps unilateralis]|uniref:Heterokaryon incompatibility domain-containing protein n=1 Tax=Ophiocordyceps unilateralis TaxID=268505 RepID=A0A2A9P6Y3_OPHUN|nr:hypothetical protein XA68_15379 [Ophiocordyceps unilateralis]